MAGGPIIRPASSLGVPDSSYTNKCLIYYIMLAHTLCVRLHITAVISFFFQFIFVSVYCMTPCTTRNSTLFRAHQMCAHIYIYIYAHVLKKHVVVLNLSGPKRKERKMAEACIPSASIKVSVFGETCGEATFKPVWYSDLHALPFSW